MVADAAARLARALGGELGRRLGTLTPGNAWGVFAGGELREAHGAGAASAAPATAAFRIASCTKSFTAASALLLAEEGLLDLDEPLADALDVPLRIRGPLGPPPTVRDALAMRAGIPTDDPWGDRQESLGDDAFAELLAAGVRAIWPAGARYEYSNLGYAIVGRIIGLRARMPYRRFVETRLLHPLGLTGTAFAPTPDAVTGYRRGPDGWEALPYSAPGAFSPIGGLFSTVADLARWCGVLEGAVDAGEVLPHGLAERMRHPETPIAGDVTGADPWQAYGLGLVVRAGADGRHIVGHSGGYPGFTTRMEWAQGTGTGVVVFESASYTGLARPVQAAFDAAFGAADALPAEPAPPAFAPWPETADAAERVRAALAAGALPDATLLDPCVDLDVPLPRRADAVAELVAGIGGVTESSAIVHDTPARASWELRGPHGTLRCSILMSPTARPRVQKLDVAML